MRFAAAAAFVLVLLAALALAIWLGPPPPGLSLTQQNYGAGVDAGFGVLFGVAVGLHPVRSSVRDISL